MALNESLTKVYVVPTPTLLASGTTVDLAVGQLGIFDGLTYAATTAPAYAKNKAILFGQGTPDINLPLMYPMPTDTNKTKIIKGKDIIDFKGFKAKRGNPQTVAIGFDGVNAEKNFKIRKDQDATLFIHLSGNPVTIASSDQGIIKQYKLNDVCKSLACDEEGYLKAEEVVDKLLKKIQEEKDFKGFIKASKIVDCTTDFVPVSTEGYTYYTLKTSDNDDINSLSTVQSQYPGLAIQRVGREGFVSTYQTVRKTSDGAPAAFSNAGLKFIADCPTCPTGYTLAGEKFIYEVRREDNGTDVAAGINTAYGTTDAVRINEDFGMGTYIITKATAITSAQANDVLNFVGKSRNSCVITSATTTAWVAGNTASKYGKEYTITLLDSCGTNRLAELQAAYPALVITQIAGGVNGCAHAYKTTVLSTLVDAGCSIQSHDFVAPQPYKGVSWTEGSEGTPAADCKAGILLEGALYNRKTNEYTFDSFAHDYDTVHIKASLFDYDYTNAPCEIIDVPVTYLKGVAYDQGSGRYVYEIEKHDKGYQLQQYSGDAGIRLAEGWVMHTDPTKFYDTYILWYEVNYMVLREKYTDRWKVTFFFPEGTGKNFEAAVNGYLASANINIPPVVLN